MTTNPSAPTAPNSSTVLHSMGVNTGFVQATRVQFVLLPNPRDPKDPVSARYAGPRSVVQRYLNKIGYSGEYPRSLLNRVDAVASDELASALAMMEAVGALAPAVAARILPFADIRQSGGLAHAGGLVAAAELAARENRVFVGPKSAESILAGIPGLNMILATSFDKLIDKLNKFAVGELVPTSPNPLNLFDAMDVNSDPDLHDIVDPPNGWRHTVRYVLELAAISGFSLALIGRPGSGRTMYARRLISLLPPLEAQEALEVRRWYSAANMPIMSTCTPRPFRAPHHTTSRSAMEGLTASASNLRRAFIPGEITLAHHGVLFLDECAEFHSDVFECALKAFSLRSVPVRQAFETVQQAAPANFQLIGAFAPCYCGYFTNLSPSSPTCGCSSTQLARYRKALEARVTRFDIALNLDQLPILATLPLASNFSNSRQVRTRVCSARARYEAKTVTTKVSMPFAQACIADAILATHSEAAMTSEAIFDARQLHAAAGAWK